MVAIMLLAKTVLQIPAEAPAAQVVLTIVTSGLEVMVEAV